MLGMMATRTWASGSARGERLGRPQGLVLVTASEAAVGTVVGVPICQSCRSKGSRTGGLNDRR